MAFATRSRREQEGDEHVDCKQGRSPIATGSQASLDRLRLDGRKGGAHARVCVDSSYPTGFAGFSAACRTSLGGAWLFAGALA